MKAVTVKLPPETAMQDPLKALRGPESCNEDIVARVKPHRENERGVLAPYEYIQKQFNSFGPEYLGLLEMISAQLHPLSPDTKIISTIPVAASEQLYICRTLETFLKQTLSRNNFEVLLLVNYPKPSTNDDGGVTRLAEVTLNEIKRFQDVHPNFPLRVATVELESPLRDPNNPNSTGINSIGWIRALLADIVVYRYMHASRRDDLLMVRDDADTRWQERGRLAAFVSLAEKHPEYKAFRGNLRPSLERLAEDPLLFVSEYLQYRVNRRWFHKFGGNEKGGGPNFAVSLSAYCSVGGYSRTTVLREDGELSEALHRNAIPILRVCTRAASLYTSTRRGEHALSHQLASVNQWSLGFGDIDKHVRLTGEGTGERRPDDARARIYLLNASFLKKIKGIIELSYQVARDFELSENIDMFEDPAKWNRFINFWRSELSGLGFELSQPLELYYYKDVPEITGFGTFPTKFEEFSDGARATLARREFDQSGMS